MGASTAIAWTDATFNPWIGCEAISPGCEHCYAESYAKRVGRDFATRTRTSAANWRQPLLWNKKAEAAGTRLRVFCASLADVFDNQVPEEWRVDLFNLIAATPWLRWQLLTKRIANARVYRLPDNVWLGATVTNQEEFDRDRTKLIEIKAAKHFLSIEPQLARIDACEAFGVWWNQTRGAFEPVDPNQPIGGGIDWVICGGESGPHARPFNLEWARSLRDVCRGAGVRFFMKQLGRRPQYSIAGRSPHDIWLADRAGADPADWPIDLRVQEFPQ